MYVCTAYTTEALGHTDTHSWLVCVPLSWFLFPRQCGGMLCSSWLRPLKEQRRLGCSISVQLISLRSNHAVPVLAGSKPRSLFSKLASRNRALVAVPTTSRSRAPATFGSQLAPRLYKVVEGLPATLLFMFGSIDWFWQCGPVPGPVQERNAGTILG